MAETPDVIRTQIARTRARLDADLDTLGEQVDEKKERLAASAQYWSGITAVVAGAAGALMFWPRRRRIRG
jgi:hypothetical protein